MRLSALQQEGRLRGGEVGKKPVKREARTPQRRIGVTLVSFRDWPKASERLREEAARSSRITAEDLKIVVNT